MPTITDIKQQQRNQGRYSIYLDGAYGLSVSDLDLISLGLRVGIELSSEEVERIRSAGEVSKGYDRALGYLSFRARTEHEIRQYLRGKEYSEESVGQIIVRLKDLGLIDDEGFARSWVRNRQALRPRSKRVLQGELAQKGVPPAISARVLGDVDEEDQLAAVSSLIQKRGGRYDSQEKLIAYLARQGFSYDLIKKALAASESDLEDEASF